MSAQDHMLQRVRTAMSRGDLGQAKFLCERLLGESKKNAEAFYIMGSILFTERRLDDAAKHLERSVALAPKNPAVHLALAQVQRLRGRNNSALRHVDRVLRLEPDSLNALYVKSEVLDARGEHEKLRKFLEPIAEVHPDDGVIQYFVAQCHAQSGDSDTAIEHLRSFLAGPSVGDADRRRMSYLLGRQLERRGDHDDAFAAFVDANSVDRHPYDAAAFEAEIDAFIDVFDASLLSAAPKASHGLDQPVLIVGMPRTGSTLIERILDAHPMVHAAGESTSMAQVVEDLPFQTMSTHPYPRCVADLDADTADRAGRSYVEALQTSGRAAKRIVDKNLWNYQNLGLLSLIVPGARVIDCRRDPVNTCIACYSASLETRAYPYASDLADLGHYHRHYQRLMRHWRDVLDIRIMTIQYEDLVADQEPMTRALIEFLELPWNDRCLKFHETRTAATTLSVHQVRQPIYRTSLSRAERYADHLQPLIDALGDDDSA